MKQSKNIALLLRFVRICCIVFLVGHYKTIAGGSNPSIGIVWSCLGSTNLCLGPLFLKKSKENSDTIDPQIPVRRSAAI